MRSTTTLITALAAAAGSLAAAGPAAAATVLVEQERPFSVDAAMGVSAYSQYDSSIDAYRLVARQDGETKTLDVNPTPDPLDVGTSRTGSLVAVYSRSEGDRVPTARRARWSRAGATAPSSTRRCPRCGWPT
jgi:hypothetical protein